MLVMSRCENESIVIDGKIEIRVCDIRKMNGHKQVRLGITAPRSISVHRKEVQEAIDREKTEGLQALTA